MISSLKWVPTSRAAAKPAFYELTREELEGDVPQVGSENAKIDATLNNDQAMDDDLGSDIDDVDLKSTDRLIVCAKTEPDGEHCSLELHVFDTTSDSLYVHHDIPLPAFPLAVELVGVSLSARHTTTTSKNFVAVATFQPEIEIWNLDVLDALEPNLILEGGHAEAVLCLSFDGSDALLSGGSDGNVVLWSLKNGSILKKIQLKGSAAACSFNANRPSTFACGTDDGDVSVFSEDSPSPRVLKGSSAVESLDWDASNADYLYVAYENGAVVKWDVPKQERVKKWQAHRDSCSCVRVNRMVKGLVATCSADGSVRLWKDCEPLAERALRVGELFEVSWDDSDPLQLAAAGSKGVVAIWDARVDVQKASSSKTIKFTDSRPESKRTHKPKLDEMNDEGELIDSDDEDDDFE